MREGLVALAVVAAALLPGAGHAQTYLRAGVGYEHGRESGFRFGGPEGRFGGTAALDAGLGYATPLLRAEALAAWRPGMRFDGPGGGRASSAAALAAAYFDLGGLGRLRPFLSVGYGVARNRFAGQATTDPAFLLAAGLGWSLSTRTTLDIGYRYIDLGSVRAGGTRAKLVAEGMSLGLRRRF